MRIEGHCISSPCVNTELNQHGLLPYSISSRLSSFSCPPCFSRIKESILSPLRYIFAFLFPNYYAVRSPSFIRTGTQSKNETQLRKELDRHFGPRPNATHFFDSYYSRDQQVLLLDQFDQILSYCREIRNQNPGSTVSTIRFDTGISYSFVLTDEKSFTDARNSFIRSIEEVRFVDLQFVVNIKYRFSSPFGKIYEKFYQNVLVDTTDGLRFR